MFVLATLTLGAMALTVTSWALTPKSVGPATAPDPAEHPDAVLQVYGADAWGVRGRFAIHTWIAAKPQHADRYTKYQVIGWRQRRGLPVVNISNSRPDGDWFGAEAVLLLDHRGAAAEVLIEKVHAAALSYPFAEEYVMWPGPNSNSFTAWVGLEVPALGLDLPAKAIGKSWMQDAYPQLQAKTLTRLVKREYQRDTIPRSPQQHIIQIRRGHTFPILCAHGFQNVSCLGFS